MRFVQRAIRPLTLLATFAVASYLALRLKGGGLWEGLPPAIAADPGGLTGSPAAYDLTQLRVVNEVLKAVRDRYVDPKRVKPREMLLSALNYVQRDVAQVIVLHEDGQPVVRVRVDTQEKEFRVDNVQGPWDVSARLREVFAFIQEGLRGTEVDLREVEYAACNGMLHTLDPHSVLLSPEAYKEMNLSTSGQFGGLGILISIRDQQLTVMNPMPSTPAGRAGLKKYDRIIKINGESTLNMGLSEAVNHLRGKEGTKVTIWIHRDGADGWPGARPFELLREIIRVVSVESKLFDGNIGYVRLKQFQANTAADLETALVNLKKNGELKGLVLDLRGNPGGLLDQAAKVADKFIAEGPIVATVGNPSEGRDEKVARPEGTEPNYPLVVLGNGSSASASEIVLGALKNHNRAIVVGETSFGKGSVQVLTDLPDKAALKLTIAQYLTEPGDISIQGTGITPDIELDPMTVDPQEMDLTVDGGMLKERDLSRSLSNVRAREGQRPFEVLRYSLPAKERQEVRERGGDPEDNMSPDFPIRFARDLVAALGPGKRLDQLRDAKPFIAETRATELEKVKADLVKMGIDWSDAPGDIPMLANASPVEGIEVKLETDRPRDEVTAGEPMNIRLSVTNKGTATLYRLSATTKSDNLLFDNKELVIGKLEPGKTRTAAAPLGWCETEGYKIGSTIPLPKDAPRVCRIPRDTLSRLDGIRIQFDEARGRIPAEITRRVTVHALERPMFSYTYQIADNRKGNGDGRVQRGESYTLYLTVKNTGKGRSYETQTNLRNLSGEGLLLREGRFDISGMQPGETRRAAFTFDVEEKLADPEAKVELSIADRDLHEVVAEKIRMPIVDPIPVAPAKGTVHAGNLGAELFQSPDPTSRVIGKLEPGVTAPVLGKAPGYDKVGLGEGRFAFVKEGDVKEGGTVPPLVAFEEAMAHAPPMLEVTPPAFATRDGAMTVHGLAKDDTRLLDAYIFVGFRKVFYRSNRTGVDPKSMAFDANVPLRPGVNVVTVVARENPDTTGRKTFVIRRDGPNGELLTTSKTEEDLSETSVAGMGE